jgi:hypothetical protein
MAFKTSYHSRKSVEPIKSYEEFSKTIYSWEYEKNAKLAHFTKEFRRPLGIKIRDWYQN